LSFSVPVDSVLSVISVLSITARFYPISARFPVLSKKTSFFLKIFSCIQSAVTQLIECIFLKIVNNFDEKKLPKNLPVSKMAVPLHRFSPLVRR